MSPNSNAVLNHQYAGRDRDAASLPHFQHIFAVRIIRQLLPSYMWSEVLDWKAVRLRGNGRHHWQAAEKLRDNICGRWPARQSDDAYIGFRGKLPSVDALLAARTGRTQRRPMRDAFISHQLHVRKEHPPLARLAS